MKPSRRSTLPTVRSCSRTANRVSIRALGSIRRQRPTEPALGRPKADPGVPVRVRPALHGRRQLGLLSGREARLASRPGPVAQAGEALGVVAVHPIPERLPVHAGRPRRFLARGPLQHQRQGQHPSRGRRVPAPPGLAPQPDRARLLPRDRHRHGPSADRLHRRSTASGASRLRARRRVSNSARWYYAAATLGAFVAGHVAAGSTVVSDGRSGYARLKDVKHDPKVIGDTPAHLVLPWIHRVFANAKRWALGVYHGLREEHLQAYLDEFVFRFNRRRTPAAAFDRLIGLSLTLEPATYQMLVVRS